MTIQEESEEYSNNWKINKSANLNFAELVELRAVIYKAHKDGAEFGYNKANESHSPDEHVDKDRVVLGIIKHCNKIRYSLVQWNGEWWYQYGTYNAEVKLISWYNIPEIPKIPKE